MQDAWYEGILSDYNSERICFVICVRGMCQLSIARGICQKAGVSRMCHTTGVKVMYQAAIARGICQTAGVRGMCLSVGVTLIRCVFMVPRVFHAKALFLDIPV